MKILFKITQRLLDEVKIHLMRPHPFAFERVGFLRCRVGQVEEGGMIVLCHSLHDVADGDYLDDSTVGAMMGPGAIRKALQTAYNEHASMFHIHLHLHRGKPRLSHVDERETARFVPDFWNVQPDLPHGAIVLSEDSAFGKCWIPGQKEPAEITRFTVVGIPMRSI